MNHRARARMHLAQATTRAETADVRAHIEAALHELDAMGPTGLVECPICERVGLPEQIAAHECG